MSERVGKTIEFAGVSFERDVLGWYYEKANAGGYKTRYYLIRAVENGDEFIDHLLTRAETAESEVAQVKALLDDANEMLASHKLRRDAELAAAKARVVELEADVAIYAERLHQVEKKLQSVASMHGADVEKISRLQNTIERLQKEKAAMESRLSAPMPTRELTIAQPISLPSDMEIAQGLEDVYCRRHGATPVRLMHHSLRCDARLAQAAYVRSLVEGKAAQPTPEQPAPDREKPAQEYAKQIGPDMWECNVCNRPHNTCDHIPGREYNGVLCLHVDKTQSESYKLKQREKVIELAWQVFGNFAYECNARWCLDAAAEFLTAANDYRKGE